MPPTMGNGKICYLAMPSADPQRSADFYAAVFGWEVRTRGDGSLAFTDSVGQVSGTWTRRLTPAQPGLLVYVMVDDIVKTCDAVTANGGEIVQPVEPAAPEVTALFRDPGGNVVGLYQERSLSGRGQA